MNYLTAIAVMVHIGNIEHFCFADKMCSICTHLPPGELPGILPGDLPGGNLKSAGIEPLT